MRVLAIAVGLLAAGVGSAAAETWPGTWTVVAEGRELRLELAVDDAGRASGSLGGSPVEGFAVGSRLVMTCTAGGRVEVWSGLRGAGPEGVPFLAGTVDRDGELIPWYGVPENRSPPADAAPPTVLARELQPTPVPAAPTPAPARVPPPTAAPSPPAEVDRPEELATVGGLTLEGRWSTPTGEVAIRQDGRRLEVVGAAGGVKSGRMTGETTFVVGMRIGCCRGELTGPGMIRWEDGTVWLRAEG